MIKRLFCRHEFKLLSTYKKDIDKGQGYDLKDIYIIYCPKCRNEKEVLEHVYEKIIAKQRVDDEYRDARELNRYKKQRDRHTDN
ncbi:hypothetical protein NUG13_11850 [Bacillus subtilis]|uniref:hypothetical protein n=1 Tax=Bacillus subtilis TaxID=1423 RepID=UPI002150355A|nr:hypothetical protein [Bacillus subtilis]MCR4362021.1 hypothetical protein [Bacillus subtilis]